MKVGLLAYALERPLGGISRYTLELARAFLRLEPSPNIRVLAAGGLGPLLVETRLHAIPLRGCRLLPGLLTLGNLMIPRVARRAGLDVVHDPTGVTPFLFGAGGARTVVTVHDVVPWSYPGSSTRLDTLIYRCWLPRVLPTVDAVITVSQTSKADLVRFLRVPPEKVHVVPEGVSEAFRPPGAADVERVRGKYRLPAKYILFVGSVEKRKNLTGLLRACARLKRMGIRVPLVVAGSTTRRYSELSATLHELDLEQDVLFTGYVAEGDLPALYGGAALFVFPSLYEGFGLPPLEAMACGTPVVCSNAASLPEVVGDAAITVDPRDPEAMARPMFDVLSSADLQETLRLRGQWHAAHFTWERTARQTAEVYSGLMSNGADREH